MGTPEITTHPYTEVTYGNIFSCFKGCKRYRQVLNHCRFITCWGIFSDQITIAFSWLCTPFISLSPAVLSPLQPRRKEDSHLPTPLLVCRKKSSASSDLVWSCSFFGARLPSVTNKLSTRTAQPYPLTSAKALRCSEEDSHSGHQTLLAHLQQLEEKTGRCQRCSSYTQTLLTVTIQSTVHTMQCFHYTGFPFHTISLLALRKT